MLRLEECRQTSDSNTTLLQNPLPLPCLPVPSPFAPLPAENCSAMKPVTKEAGEDSTEVQDGKGPHEPLHQVPCHLRPSCQSRTWQDDEERDSCGLQEGMVAPRTVFFPGGLFLPFCRCLHANIRQYLSSGVCSYSFSILGSSTQDQVVNKIISSCEWKCSQGKYFNLSDLLPNSA